MAGIDLTRDQLVHVIREVRGKLGTPESLPKNNSYNVLEGIIAPLAGDDVHWFTDTEQFEATKRLLQVDDSHRADTAEFLSLWMLVQMEYWKISEEELDAG